MFKKYKKLLAYICILTLLLTLFTTFNTTAYAESSILNNGDIIALVALANDRYVTADPGLPSPLIAKSTAIGQWEKFVVNDLGNGNYAFLSLSNAKYVCADNAGANPLIANRPSAGPWETFQVTDLGNGNISLKAQANNSYVCADNAGANPLIANRTSAGQWESFKPVKVASDSSTYSTSQFENGTVGGGTTPPVIQTWNGTGTNSATQSNFYGTGFTAWFGSDGQYSSVTVVVPAAGTYKMKIRYASPSSASRQILVNGVSIADNYAFASTIDWSFWKVTNEFSCNLNTGNNTITVKYDASKGSSNYINLDEVRVYNTPTPAVAPGIASTSLGSSDVIVCTTKVTDYGADSTGIYDSTAAFQAAIDEADAAGGGQVFVPSGKYKLYGTLRVGYSITLRGEWKSPDAGGSGLGTILEPFAFRDNAAGEAFLTAYTAATIRDLSIWYPEQSVTSVHQYPYSIDGNHADGTQDTINVMNVTLYNSYNGIKTDYTHGCTTVRNVYGTVLNTGIFEDKGFDIGRYENIFFNTTYWTNSGLSGAPSQSELNAYTQAHTIGIDMYEDDWGFFYGLNMQNMLTGVQFDDANCSITNMTTSNMNTAIKINRIAYPGLQIANSTLSANIGTNPVCLSYSDSNISHNTTGYEVVSVSNTTFSGQPSTCVTMNGGNNPVLNLNNCTFSDWGYSGGTYAIDAEKGALVVSKCSFQKDARAIKIGSATSAANILGNTFNGSAQIDNLKGSNVNIDNTAISMPVMPSYSYTFAPVYRPANENNLYNVRNSPYNAKADGTTDDTNAIQSALNAASGAGGGTVYMPAGYYRINGSLTIPSGVELRGTYDGPHSGKALGGTQMFAYGGKDNADGTPLVNVSANASVRGISFFYPEQGYTAATIHAYPWTIRGLGSNCSVTDVALVNAYNGIDMMTNTCNNNVVADMNSFSLYEHVRVGNGIIGGWLQDVHFNPCNWVQSKYPNTPDVNAEQMYAYCTANTIGFKLGSCSNYYNFQNFTIGDKIAVQLVADSAGSYSGIINGFAFDANYNGLDIQQAGNVSFINPMDVSYQNGGGPNIRTENSFTGTLNYFNGASWGRGTQVCDINGGTVNLVQYDSWCCPNAKANAGILNLYACVFAHQPNTSPDCVFENGITSGTVIGTLGRAGLNITNNVGAKLAQSYNLSY